MPPPDRQSADNGVLLPWTAWYTADSEFAESASTVPLSMVASSSARTCEKGIGDGTTLDMSASYSRVVQTCRSSNSRPDQPPLKLRRLAVALATAEGLRYI